MSLLAVLTLVYVARSGATGQSIPLAPGPSLGYVWGAGQARGKVDGEMNKNCVCDGRGRCRGCEQEREKLVKKALARRKAGFLARARAEAAMVRAERRGAPWE